MLEGTVGSAPLDVVVPPRGSCWPLDCCPCTHPWGSQSLQWGRGGREAPSACVHCQPGAREAWRGNRASQRGQESPSRQPPHIPHQGQFTLHAPRAEVQGPDTVAPLFDPTFDTGRAGELSTDPLAQKKDTQQWTLLSCVVPVRLPADRCGESG